jgi:hypothetical protein
MIAAVPACLGSTPVAILGLRADFVGARVRRRARTDGVKEETAHRAVFCRVFFG